MTVKMYGSPQWIPMDNQGLICSLQVKVHCTARSSTEKDLGLAAKQTNKPKQTKREIFF